jgi:hypothetical protein
MSKLRKVEELPAAQSTQLLDGPIDVLDEIEEE